MGGSSTESIAEWVRSSTNPFRIVANATWLGAGRPVHAPVELRVGALRGVVEYVPGDLTMTVRSGTSHADIDSITEREGQWLGLDPAGHADGTIGATVATASAGPLQHAFGAVRDIVLGVEVVSGTGIVTRSGGKVVKNVAGFDLVRLQTGAWGTLGVITELSLRLRARPETDVTVALELDARVPVLAHLVGLRGLTLSALAVELIGAGLARALGLSDGTLFLVRLGGNSTRVRAQLQSLSTLGPLLQCDSAVWDRLREAEVWPSAPADPAWNADHGSLAEGGPPAIARVSHRPSDLATTWAHVHATLRSASLEGLVRATVSRGVVRVVIPERAAVAPAAFVTALAGVVTGLAPAGGHVLWEQLPAAAWAGVASSVADPLSLGLQRAFDPANRCNSGILGASFSP